ncbi:carbohydrate ABC transporter permease [Marinomonas mediterranea]|uniref:ABC-type transporter, integral membrane subunit n=1 Tax=Marinomonas mediterranea (strain ATCC 700492 / JCM 21426 / NBRC 103028 / MMB-1) TaxID=717774 RepID=F2K0J1_MARM1|nr:carbohydrate ABC transporter permease [Marinomonas mediterranea]ADZ90975.1 ABC-type transporter, integral membrane subunit [Marinomonas mediterranea MMB-1]WCN17118.1 ABC transporter permease subunit [Marinomonas mediterranea MMB-1]
MMNKRTKLQSFILYALVIFLVVFCIFPFLQILSTSLKHPIDWGNPSLIPKVLHLDAYKELLGLMPPKEIEVPASIQRLLDNPALSETKRQALLAKFTSGGDVFSFGRYMLNTFVISLVTGVCATFLASLAAYAIARLRFPGQSVMANGVLFVYMVGGVLLMVPLYQMSVSVGLASSVGGTLLSLFLIYLIQTLPVAMYMLGNYFRTIPFSLEEAAMMDGCSRVEAFWRIIMPLSKPMLFTVFIYCFVIAWNEYLFASVFLKQYQDFHTLPLALQTLFTSKNAIWDRIMAASMLTLLPVIICFMLANRHLSGGLTEGGVKG